jgi:YidC/Oxa1 family membrane protein insertase
MSWFSDAKAGFSGWRRFLARDKSRREAVFYAEQRADWVHLGPVAESLCRDHGIAVHYLSSERKDPALARDLPNFTGYYIGDGTIRTMAFSTMETKLFVMTLPDIETFHLKKAPRVGHYAYIFHSINSAHMVYLPAAFDHYDPVLCVGPHHIGEIRKREEKLGLPPKTLLEHGYGRLDALRAKYDPVPPAPSAGDRPWRILVAPSWGPQGIIETMGERLVGHLLEAGHRVTLRPHPMTRRTAPASLAAVEKSHGANPRFTLEEDVTTDASLREAHLLITDWSGIGYEYAFCFERPVLYLDTARKIRNPDYGLLEMEPLEVSIRTELGEVVSPDRLDTLPEAAARLISGAADYPPRIRASREKWVFNPGTSGRAGAEALAKLCGQ